MISRLRLWLSDQEISRTFGIFWLSLITVAVALRVYNLTAHPMWFDEVWSVIDASRSAATIIVKHATVFKESHPPLYSLLLHFWMALFGPGVVSVRSLSVLFGVLTVPLIYVVGKKIGNRAIGLIAAILLTFSPFHVYYSQETRMYTLALFLCVLSTYFMLRFIEGKDKSLIGFSIVSLIGIYTIYYAGLVLVAQNIFIFVMHRKNRAVLKKWIVAQAAILIGYIPWCITFVSAILGGRRVGMISTTGLEPLSTFLAFCVGFKNTPPIVINIAMIIFLISAIYGIYYFREAKDKLFLLLIILLLPVEAAFLASFFGVWYLNRALITILFAFYIIVSAGLVVLNKRRIGLILLACILFLNLFSLSNYYFFSPELSDPERKYVNTQEPMQYLRDHMKKGDAIVNNDIIMYLPFEYYLGDGNRLYWVSPPDKEIDEMMSDLFDIRRTTLSEIVASHRRIWIVQANFKEPSDLWLVKHAKQLIKLQYPDLSLTLYETTE